MYAVVIPEVMWAERWVQHDSPWSSSRGICFHITSSSQIRAYAEEVKVQPMKADFELCCIVAVGSGASGGGVRASSNCKKKVNFKLLEM